MNKLTNTSKENAVQFFFIANGFKSTYDYLFNNVFNKVLDTSCNNLSPLVSNGIFTIEAYFKFLIAFNFYEKGEQNAQIEKTHYIDCLFCKLSTETQNKILEELKNKDVSENEFRAFLKENANGFIKWRYPSDKSLETDTRIITETIIVLSKLCKERINITSVFDGISPNNSYTITITPDLYNDWQTSQNSKQ